MHESVWDGAEAVLVALEVFVVVTGIHTACIKERRVFGLN